MTVPHDAVLCVGLGIAAHLAAPKGRPLRSATKKIACEGFLLGWIPMTSILLWNWPEWSWWYWEPVLSSRLLSFGLGVGLEVAGFALGLIAMGILHRSAQWTALALTLVVEALLLSLPFDLFNRVGSLSEIQAGGGTPLLSSWSLLTSITVGGLWLTSFVLWTGLRIRRHSLRDSRLGARSGFL